MTWPVLRSSSPGGFGIVAGDPTSGQKERLMMNIASNLRHGLLVLASVLLLSTAAMAQSGVSKGSCTMPTLVGMTVGKAILNLGGPPSPCPGLGAIKVASSTSAAGTVTSATNVPKGAAKGLVDLGVSSGNGTVQALAGLDLVSAYLVVQGSVFTVGTSGLAGLDLPTAYFVIQRMGLTLGSVTPQYSNTVPVGKLISATLANGVVQVIISAGQ